MLGGCIYGMNLVPIGLLLTLKTEGQNLQNQIKSKIGGGEVRLDLSLKDALFIYLSEYVTFRMSFGRERQNYKKSQKNTNLNGN